MSRIARILVIDDDDTSNFIAHRQLMRYNVGEEIIILTNGLEAKEYIVQAKHMPDMVLLDINMPVMGGFEFLEWLDGSAFKGKTKISIYSTSVRQEDREIAARYNDVFDYVEKPLTGEKIEQMLSAFRDHGMS